MLPINRRNAPKHFHAPGRTAVQVINTSIQSAKSKRIVFCAHRRICFLSFRHQIPSPVRLPCVILSISSTSSWSLLSPEIYYSCYYGFNIPQVVLGLRERHHPRPPIRRHCSQTGGLKSKYRLVLFYSTSLVGFFSLSNGRACFGLK